MHFAFFLCCSSYLKINNQQQRKVEKSDINANTYDSDVVVVVVICFVCKHMWFSYEKDYYPENFINQIVKMRLIQHFIGLKQY